MIVIGELITLNTLHMECRWMDAFYSNNDVRYWNTIDGNVMKMLLLSHVIV